MRSDVKWWLRRYVFLLIVLVTAWIPVMMLVWFLIVPTLMYFTVGEWVIDKPERIFRDWLAPVVIGLITSTGYVTYEWYLNTFGHPVKKAIYAILFCAVVWVFVFAVLIPWGRDMVPHLVNWWHGL
jgi:hypothetical protein